MSAPFDKEHYRPTDTFAFEALTVSSSAVGFTAATYSPGGAEGGTPAVAADVSVEGAQVRYRADGTDPTASVGAIKEAGDEFIVWGTMDIQSIKFIATGGDATLSIHYAR